MDKSSHALGEKCQRPCLSRSGESVAAHALLPIPSLPSLFSKEFMATSNQKENTTPGLTNFEDAERAVISIAAELARETHPDAASRPPRLSDKLDDDLAFDSLSRVEFLRRIERELGLTLSESQLFQTATLE
ncbi:MAG: acyl carrier protein, partial [Bdellovibrionota bacterium]